MTTSFEPKKWWFSCPIHLTISNRLDVFFWRANGYISNNRNYQSKYPILNVRWMWKKKFEPLLVFHLRSRLYENKKLHSSMAFWSYIIVNLQFSFDENCSGINSNIQNVSIRFDIIYNEKRICMNIPNDIRMHNITQNISRWLWSDIEVMNISLSEEMYIFVSVIFVALCCSMDYWRLRHSELEIIVSSNYYQCFGWSTSYQKILFDAPPIRSNANQFLFYRQFFKNYCLLNHLICKYILSTFYEIPNVLIS